VIQIKQLDQGERQAALGSEIRLISRKLAVSPQSVGASFPQDY
jgi:hypothetical protein